MRIGGRINVLENELFERPIRYAQLPQIFKSVPSVGERSYDKIRVPFCQSSIIAAAITLKQLVEITPVLKMVFTHCIDHGFSVRTERLLRAAVVTRRKKYGERRYQKDQTHKVTSSFSFIFFGISNLFKYEESVAE